MKKIMNHFIIKFISKKFSTPKKLIVHTYFPKLPSLMSLSISNFLMTAFGFGASLVSSIDIINLNVDTGLT